MGRSLLYLSSLGGKAAVFPLRESGGEIIVSTAAQAAAALSQLSLHLLRSTLPSRKTQMRRNTSGYLECRSQTVESRPSQSTMTLLEKIVRTGPEIITCHGFREIG